MFKEKRQIAQNGESGKTDLGMAAKGLATNNPEKFAVGTMGGQPSPPEKLISESREIQGGDPESIISKVKRNIITLLKTPTTLAKSGLEVGHGSVKWITNQINKAVYQVVNVGAVALAIPVKLWEVGTSPVKKGITKIRTGTHDAVDKVINILPANPPRQAMAA